MGVTYPLLITTISFINSDPPYAWLCVGVMGLGCGGVAWDGWGLIMNDYDWGVVVGCAVVILMRVVSSKWGVW